MRSRKTKVVELEGCMKKLTVVLMLGLVFASGVLEAKSPLSGSWQAAKANAPKPTLTFKDDGTYEIDTTGDGKPEVSGKYQLQPNRQVVFSEKGSAGIYTYEADGPALQLIPDTDNNESRKKQLHVVWVRKP